MGKLLVWPCNLCVAEMCAYLPIRGSIFEFVDPALGFAMGWTYFYAGVMLVCAEYSAVATLMQYWKNENATHSYYADGGHAVFRIHLGIVCSSRDKRLMGAIEDNAAGSAASPWAIGTQNLGITGLPDLINAMILLSHMYCGNAHLYSSSRTFYGLARGMPSRSSVHKTYTPSRDKLILSPGQAPGFLVKWTKSGFAIYCVALVSLVTFITFLVTAKSAVQVLNWFVDLTTTSLIATYTYVLVIFVFLHSIQCSLVFWMYVWKGTEMVDPRTADLVSGKAKVDEECRVY
ncbi:hypothetical protein MAC_09511 [Metarhizium acridum CQMa 102]|uniref:Amino acid permease/ SLC12A domain-containing protein n=1 Tax=Metarhizium acridum (strain CQMa 102) TaxID=655827 RepID=E9EI13_METAQ|nr:uncharacterized protein MAC_09511 [Metarhizium acridum CQMa 102]EFY84454.1 hypothetical protein MAC_09511 [Metarhizium acridum CQMa 102]